MRIVFPKFLLVNPDREVYQQPPPLNPQDKPYYNRGSRASGDCPQEIINGKPYNFIGPRPSDVDVMRYHIISTRTYN